jgi:putative tryptophan/tyrosine transport system substrate-binding protein
MFDMRRRDFITILGGAVVASPIAARAQQSERMRRVGVLTTAAENDATEQRRQAAFRRRFDELGWRAGRNIQIDYRWAASNADRLRIFAKELVELKPDLIFAETTPATAAVLGETRTIPIVFVVVSDPVGSGFVTSLNRPGGNVTGFMNMEPTLAGKWLGLLKEIALHVTRVALLFNPATAPFTEQYLNPFKAAAASLAVEAIAAPVQQLSHLEPVAADRAREPNGGLIMMPDVFLWLHRAEVISLAAHYRLPAVYPQRDFAEIGGLLSYGNDRLDQYPRAAIYADRILKGEKPADLPVQAPTKYELVINLRTAKALGLTVPPSLVATADEVIE